MHSYLRLKRQGPRPRTSGALPQQQLDQNAPPELQEKVYAVARALSGVRIGESLVSVEGTRAFHLPGCTEARHEPFLMSCEFAHIHPAYDGSLHMALPPEIHHAAIENGWAEQHPLAGRYGFSRQIVLVYGPRDEDELGVVTDLLKASHRYATGTPDPG